MQLALGILGLALAALVLWRLVLLGRALTELRERLGRIEGAAENSEDKLSRLRAAADRLEARAKELLEHIDLLPPKIDGVHAKIPEEANAVKTALQDSQEERARALAEWLSDRFAQLERDLYFAHLVALAQSYHDGKRIDAVQFDGILEQLSRARMEHLSRSVSPLPSPPKPKSSK